MEDQFVTYELAIKLKELGFNKKCLASWYTPDNSPRVLDFESESIGYYHIKAPLWQQGFSFILSKQNLEIVSDIEYSLEFSKEFNLMRYKYTDDEGFIFDKAIAGNEQSLIKLIELVEKQ